MQDRKLVAEMLAGGVGDYSAHHEAGVRAGVRGWVGVRGGGVVEVGGWGGVRECVCACGKCEALIVDMCTALSTQDNKRINIDVT